MSLISLRDKTTTVIFPAPPAKERLDKKKYGSCPGPIGSSSRLSSRVTRCRLRGLSTHRRRSLGLAWIQVENENSNQIISSFKASNYGWPLSTKAEVLAIYTALLAVVADSHVKIYTDSAVAISQYNSFKNIKSERIKGKINQKNIWEVIFGLIKKYNLKVELFKVQAHTGIWGNEKADVLAKEDVDDF